MGLSNEYSYYGYLGGEKPIRTLSEDLVIERKKQMIQDLKSMEERIKRHITECKREIIKELILQNPTQTNDIKELKNGSKIKHGKQHDRNHGLGGKDISSD